MNTTKYLSIVIALSFIVAFPYKAFSDKHIPFIATYLGSGPERFIKCDGPWGRSDLLNGYLIPPGAYGLTFYSAEVTKFSPYGKWTCHNCDTSLIPKCNAEVHFCLEKFDDAAYFSMTSDSLMAYNLPANCDTITTQATLGDDNTKPKRDRDTFTFNFGPNPGDRLVTVTLEEDPEAGHDGEQATLILRNGNSTIESKTDAMPIEISATLPSDGEYELVVQQQNIPEDVRFRGNYYLSVKSDTGDIQEIKPSDDVEQ